MLCSVPVYRKKSGMSRVSSQKTRALGRSPRGVLHASYDSFERKLSHQAGLKDHLDARGDIVGDQRDVHTRGNKP